MGLESTASCVWLGQGLEIFEENNSGITAWRRRQGSNYLPLRTNHSTFREEITLLHACGLVNVIGG